MIKYIILAFLVLPLSACKEEKVSTDGLVPVKERLSIITTDGKEHPFDIELAITLEEKATGLMHRTEMAEDAGMLFYFGDEVKRTFWMKNTLIPLDMLFVKRDGTIRHIHENAVPHDLTVIPSQGGAAAVLEINGGMSQKLGIKAGDRVKHEFFSYDPAQ